MFTEPVPMGTIAMPMNISMDQTPTTTLAPISELMAEKTETTVNAIDDHIPIDNTHNARDRLGLCADEWASLEKKVRRKVDVRLCTIAGLLCSLNLLDSGILSSAAVTRMLGDLELNQGSRYSISIFIFTIASVVFQLPCTIAVRFVGPRVRFATITFVFGLLTLCTAFIHSWRQMIALRVLLGISMSSIYPGLTYLISGWYARREQQLQFAFLQSGEVVILATGNLVNYGLNHLDGRAGLAGWRWMYLVQGLITCVLGMVSYWWMVDFPENSHLSFCFLSGSEARIASHRIQEDRADLVPEPFSWSSLLSNSMDLKIYGFACMFFLLDLVSSRCHTSSQLFCNREWDSIQTHRFSCPPR